MDIYELNSEFVLLNLFDFKLELSNEFSRYNIIDKNKIIGFIEKRIISYTNGNPNFVIYTEFVTDDMIYKKTREITNNNINSYKYSIAKRNNDGSVSYVNLNLGNIKEISFEHNKHLASLTLKNNELNLELKSKIFDYDVKEKMIINASNKENFNKSYRYSVDFNDKLNNKKTFSIIGNELYHYFIPSIGECFNYTFRLNTRIVVNGKIVENNYYKIDDGKVRDLIVKHNDGLEMFSHFKYLANKVLPFKKEVISYIFDISYLPLEFLIFVSNDYRRVLKKVKNRN